MKIAEIDFPGPLLNALRDGELVIFAGAGVSMGTPACLPNFESLVRMIAKGTVKALQDREPIDGFLGRLQHKGVDVHTRAAEVLSREDLKATELHRDLLRLYSGTEQVRVVTTNFDLLFEQAAKEVFDSLPEVFRAPALPLGRQFNGIVHVHGAVTHYDEMVITDADFGRAYLTEGWARRFLVELFSNFTTLFVGYSHNDPIMNYLARALLPSETNRRFALTPENDTDTQRWRVLGIEPINYPQPSEGDHSVLDKGIRGLAELVRRSYLDWHREITVIAEKLPPLDEETVDLIEDALGDATMTRFFTKAASDPKWIDWLDERGHLNALFGNDTLSERDKTLSRWLAEQFACDFAAKLFLLIGKHNTRLHPHFWDDLGHRIGADKETSWNKDILSRWILLLLATAQGHVVTSDLVHVDTDTPLRWMGERCIAHGMIDSLLQIFDWMMGSRLRLQQNFFRLNGGENSESPPVDVELPLIGKRDALNELWEKGLKPKLSQVAEPLLGRVIKRLEEQYLTLRIWGEAWEPESDWRSAIEPHEQNKDRAVDVLIDAARDCLEWLASNQIETAARWCDRLVCLDAPLLRRLAVHGLSKREDLTADDKIDWLLTHIDLHESPIRHEVFQAVRQAYPEASQERREDLIEAVRAYRCPNEEEPKREMYTARQHFKWFDWLHKSDSNCALARQALDAVSAECPDFEPSEPPDRAGMQSPWTPEELLAKPATDRLDDLLSFPGMDSVVKETTRQNFDWGLGLADALDRAEKWDVYLWKALINTWSTMNLGEDRHRKVLHWLGKAQLYPKHNPAIADALYALVNGTSYALNLLPQANKIAAALWRNLDRTEQIEERESWRNCAINHPAGYLAEFWLSGFSLWRKQQAPKPTVLSDEYRKALSGIVRDPSLPGRLGRTILTSRFACLLAVDEAWTREYLLPLFDPDSDDFQAAWDGFTWGRLNPAVAKAMTDPFLKAVERINSDLSNQRDQFIKQFIKHYTDMLAYFVEDPLDEWIPKLFQYGTQETPSTTTETAHTERELFPRGGQKPKDCFASEMGNRLQYMDEAEQQECWQRWLKRYWKNRLQGVPDCLESGEVAHMLDWLPHLTSVFPEAVDLAVQMPQAPQMLQAPLQDYWVINSLSESDLWQSHPEAVAKLLIYLWKFNLPRDSWYSVQQLIDQLLPLDISPELKRELQEIKIQIVSPANTLVAVAPSTATATDC